MRPARFGLSFVLVSIIGGAIYISLFLLQLGTRTSAEYWVYDAKTVKHQLVSEAAEQPKILFLGGSSVWFGIDAALVQQASGIQTLNLGLHAMRPLDQIVREVQPALRPGDTIIMPLEYGYYLIDTPFNEWYVNQVMAGVPDLFWALGWQERISFFLSVPPMRVAEGIVTKVVADRMDRMRKRNTGQPPERVMSVLQQDWRRRTIPEEPYTFRNIGPHGDAIVAQGSFTSYKYPISERPVALAYPWNTLAAFSQYCKDHSVELYIGWPPVVNGEMAFDSPQVRDNVRMIERRLAQLKLQVLGQPEEFQYDRRLFADTGYHLNHEGRRLNTKHMLDILESKVGQRWCGPGAGSCRPEDKFATHASLKRSPD